LIGGKKMPDQKLLADLKNVLYVDRIYASLNVLGNRPKNTRKLDLALTELRLFSQNGEDGVLNAILTAIGDSVRYFVEFGVGDGWSCNCRLLAEAFDWSGLFLETGLNDFSFLKQRYVNSRRVKCENIAVTPSNINQLFKKHNVPEKFGVLSIDIDGQDYWTWKALDEDYQPDVVVIEYNSALDPFISLVEEQDLQSGFSLGKHWGASQKALVDLGMKKGYRLVHIEMAAVNLFFVREKTIQEKQIELNGIIDGRSPNYRLKGRNHTDEILYDNGLKIDRPQIHIDTD
jgi:hypothetical protein